MRQHGVESYEGVYDLPLGADVIAVYKVHDEDLAALKRDHPADMVRLSAAGIEGEYMLANALQRDTFFLGGDSRHSLLYWLSYANSVFYVGSGTDRDAQDLVDQMAGREPEQDDRDFTGHDFTAWVYDLFRPDEPYASRGEHPSGGGVDRYRGTEDLTQDEHDYLKRIREWIWLNFLNPGLLRHTSFTRSGSSYYWAAGHWLTSFGDAVDARFWWKNESHGFAAAARAYRNHERWFPGLSVDGLPSWNEATLWRRVRLDLWQQPPDLQFRTRAARVGGLAEVEVAHAMQGWQLYAVMGAKTQGRVPGVVYQEDAQWVLTGLQTQW